MNRVVCAGSNFFGQMGIGPHERKRPSFCPVNFGSGSPTEERLVEDSTDIQCGSNFTTVLDVNGEIHMCGSMNGTIFPNLMKVQMTYPMKCTQIACGRKHILALGENGFVVSWGTGHFGQLGHGDDSNYNRPKIVSALEPRRIGSRVVRVSCGGSHSGVITNSGMVFMWGLNRSGQTGTGSKLDSVVSPQPIDTGDVHGGSLMASDLVLGRNHSAIVTVDGRLYTWGAGTYGRLGLTDGRKKVNRPSELKFFTAKPINTIAIGDFHNLALCRNGELYSWGHNLEGQCGLGTAINVKTPKKIDFFGPEFRVKEISCGPSWCVAVSSSGRAYSWGHGDGGWLCTPSPIPPLVDEYSLERTIPYVDSTPEDPVATAGLMHTRSFDSCHNVMLPRAIRFSFEGCDEPGAECVVEGVRTGGAVTILYLSKKRYRIGAVPSNAESKHVGGDVVLVQHSSSTTVVDSKFEHKSSSRSVTSVSSTTLTSGQDIRDPEDRCLSLMMIKNGSWMYGVGSGAGSAGVDFYSITTESSTSFTASTASATASFSVKSTPQAPGIDGMDNDQLQAVLFSWCRHNKIRELSYALLNRGIFADSRDSSGNTPLMVACQNGHAGLCQMLVEQANAAVNLKNSKGNTALHFCMAFGFEAVGQYLISRGADEFATNADGLTCYEGLCAADLERF